MTLEWEQIIVDSADPVALGRWWAEALGWVVVDESEEIIEIRPEPDRMPGLLFVPVAEGKTSKNRLHPDFRPDDQEAEVPGCSPSVPGASTPCRTSSTG